MAELPVSDVNLPRFMYMRLDRKVLIDVSGEVQLNVALRIVTQEAIAHRLEHLAEQIDALERKYGMPFAQFEARYQAGDIAQPYSYAVEQDYLEWEGLLCRQRRLKAAGDGLR